MLEKMEIDFVREFMRLLLERSFWKASLAKGYGHLSGCTKRATRRKALVRSSAGISSLHSGQYWGSLQVSDDLALSGVKDELDDFINLLLADGRNLPLPSHYLRKASLRFSPVTARGSCSSLLLIVNEGILNEASGLLKEILLSSDGLTDLLLLSLALGLSTLLLVLLAALVAPLLDPIKVSLRSELTPST